MLQGLSVSPGHSRRPGGHHPLRRACRLSGGPSTPDELDEEERRLRRAARKAAEDFDRHSREAKGDIGSELAAILEAHGLIAEDETYLGAIIERIRSERVNAEWALAEVTREFGEKLAAADSAAMREREADLTDVAREIQAHLTGRRAAASGGAAPGLASSSPTSSRRSTPPGWIRAGCAPWRSSAADRPPTPRSSRARSACRPSWESRTCAKRSRRSYRSSSTGTAASSSPTLEGPDSPEPRAHPGGKGAVPAASRPRGEGWPSRGTASGSRSARTSSCPRRSRPSSATGPRASGSFAPSSSTFGRFRFRRASQEQRRAYETLLEAAAPHPAVIRTYDLGGEKGIGPAPGDNPALGLRGLRYCLAHPELFVEQLTALCLAARKGKLRILLPMVTSLSELKAARRLLEKAASRTGLSEAPELGVMIEVPSAALMADRLAAEADFFSIGTNDLTQYGLAVDRANPDVSALYRPLHPAILRMIRLVVEAGAAHGRPVAVCGELAADPIGAAVLVGLGIVDLSVTPVAIPEVKEILSSIEVGRVRELALRALDLDEAAEVEKLFGGNA